MPTQQPRWKSAVASIKQEEASDVFPLHTSNRSVRSNSVVISRVNVEALPLIAIEAISEHLVAIGQLRSLAAFNVTSRTVHTRTLPILWRTVIWDPSRKDLELEGDDKERCWKTMMIASSGARYIQ